MEGIIAQNLYDYASIMKKQLYCSIILGILTPFTIYAIFINSLGLVFISGLILLVCGIAIIVFFIQMMTRLGRAKNISQDKFLVDAYNLQIVVIILIVADFVLPDVLGFISGIVQTIINIIIIQNIVKYVSQYIQNQLNSPDWILISNGFNLFMYTQICGICLNIISYIVSDSLSLAVLLIIATIALLLAIVGISGQFKIANGMMNVTSKYGATQFPQYQQQQDYRYQNQNTSGQPNPYGQPNTFYDNQSMESVSQEDVSQRTTIYPEMNSSEKSNLKRLICDECGQELQENEKFCSKCGNRIF